MGVSDIAGWGAFLLVWPRLSVRRLPRRHGRQHVCTLSAGAPCEQCRQGRPSRDGCGQRAGGPRQQAGGWPTAPRWPTARARAQEGARRNDLLGEYTGELVGQAEADRRGRAYDRDGCSYLFNLDRDWVLDARRRGNKLRFVNHRRARVRLHAALPATAALATPRAGRGWRMPARARLRAAGRGRAGRRSAAQKLHCLGASARPPRLRRRPAGASARGSGMGGPPSCASCACPTLPYAMLRRARARAQHGAQLPRGGAAGAGRPPGGHPGGAGHPGRPRAHAGLPLRPRARAGLAQCRPVVEAVRGVAVRCSFS